MPIVTAVPTIVPAKITHGWPYRAASAQVRARQPSSAKMTTATADQKMDQRLWDDPRFMGGSSLRAALVGWFLFNGASVSLSKAKVMARLHEHRDYVPLSAKVRPDERRRGRFS